MAAFLNALEASPTFLLISLVVLGLVVGSFLNVVILRLPRMMEQAWREEARSILELPAPEKTEPRVTLAKPASHCPGCQHRIRWYENVPVISWLVLRGRCSQCGMAISVRYPVIELAAALVAAMAAWQLGFGGWMFAVVLASWVLLALTMIDFDTTLLPDSMTYPLLWAGLLLALAGVSPVSLEDAVIGAVAGYMVLWTLYWSFKLLTGKEGMGYGDFKLLGALGAWVGWQLLPMVILLSSLVGAVVGGLLLATGVVKRDQGIPFGPYLAGAGWITLLWGVQLSDLWLNMFRL